MTHAQTDALAGLWGVDRLLGDAESLEPPLGGSALALRFDDNGNAMGSAGCNSYRGSCHVDGENITFGALATTRRFCTRPFGVMEQEARFLGLLSGTVAFSLGVDGTLILFGEADTPVVVLSRRDEETTEVEG
jgi:heat shock protein HslJ